MLNRVATENIFKVTENKSKIKQRTLVIWKKSFIIKFHQNDNKIESKVNFREVGADYFKRHYCGMWISFFFF